MRTRRLLVLLTLAVTTAGCGTAEETPGGSDSPGPAARAPAAHLGDGESDAVDALAPGPPSDPSDFQWGDGIFHFLTEDGRVLDEHPWTACLANGCWDGAPGLGGPIRSVGSPEALYFALDYPGWTFDDVSFNPVEDDCGGRTITVRAEPVTDRVFRIDPAGLAGEWRIDVFGRSAAGGDAVTSVRWTTPAQGSMPRPHATGSLFTDDDGRRVAPYGGPELFLTDLARTPADASATWTVSDRSGASVTVPLHREKARCAREGSVSFQGRELSAAELETLSGSSVTYTVEVTLDATTYTGTSRWPQDETDEAPYTGFIFDPPLPAYRG